MLVRLVGDKIDHAIRDHDVGRVVGDRQVLKFAEAISTFPVPMLRALSRVTAKPKNRVPPAILRAALVVASAERWTWRNRRRSNEGPELLPGRSPLTREMLQNDERNPQVLMSHKFRHCTNTFRMFLAFSALLSIVVSSNIAMAQPRCNLDNHCACGADGHCVDNSQHYSCYCVCAPTLCTVDNELKAEWKDLLPTEEFYGIKGRRE